LITLASLIAATGIVATGNAMLTSSLSVTAVVLCSDGRI
jgi:hypothetical protein